MRTLLRVFGLALALLLAVLLVRAATMTSRQLPVTAVPAAVVDEAAAAERLAQGLRIATVSNQDGAARDDAAFEEFQRHLETAFPRVHAAFTRERVGGLSLLYTWRGSDPSLAPVVLLAHQDVVPVEPGTESAWDHPPFGGVIADGFVWGRGALDDKLNVLGQLEAAESLLAEGVQPKRTLLFGFGHDEEIGGADGAVAIVALLKSRGIAPLFVLDEGGSIIEGLVPGVTAPVAAVGISEKGYVSVVLEVEGQGGHSSTPPAETSIGILAAAVGSLERSPFPPRLDGPSRMLIEEGVGPEAGFAYRIVYGNLWLFGPLVERILARVPAASSLIRTSTALTQFNAGVKDNVIPSRARAVANFRILPGETIESVTRRVTDTVNDPRVVVSTLPKQREPSPPSRADGEGWEILARSIREVNPDTIVAPALMLAGTDSRHFRTLTDSVYRFMPLTLELDDTKRIHGTNERVSVSGYADLIRGYRRILANAGGG